MCWTKCWKFPPPAWAGQRESSSCICPDQGAVRTLGWDQNVSLFCIFSSVLHVGENAPLLVSRILEDVHSRNYNVRATCSNSVSDGLCVRTHNFSLFTQRPFNCVYLLKKRKQGIPGCPCHTQTYTHWDWKQSRLYAPHSWTACFLQPTYVTLSEPRALAAPPLVSNTIGIRPHISHC